MGCSGSKAKDAAVERVSQHQLGLDTIADTAKEAAVEELMLHPAAAIVRDEVLAGVIDENTALEDENSRFRHLRDSVQKLDITFFTPMFQPGQGSIAGFITYHQTMQVKTLLSYGNVVLVDDEDDERLVIPINDAGAHPIDDCGVVGLISGDLAGLPIGSFPLTFGDPKVRVEDDGSVHLTLNLSPLIYIDGRLDAGISNGALAAYVEREDFMTFMRIPALFPLFNVRPSQVNGITFTPTSVSMLLTTHIKKALTFVSETDSPSDIDEDSADILRRHVVDALGESEHKDLLSKNLELKCESAALTGIRNLILGVDVSHSAGSWGVTLDEGEKLRDATWHITLHNRENMSLSLPVADMGSIGLSFFGMQLRMEKTETLALFALFGQTEVYPIFFRLQCCPGIYFILLGIFNWDDFNENEIPDIVEDFNAKFSSVLEGNGADVFPTTLNFSFVGMLCDLSLADNLLEMIGLSKQPDSDE